jgi:predicted Rossmann-fold nucleotide-binding protein
VVMFGREFWEGMLNFDFMVEQGVIGPEDMQLFSYVETAEEAWELIRVSLE